MGRIAAIGELVRIQGLALAGARQHPAADDAAVLAAWHSLGDDVDLVILTPAAAAALAAVAAEPGSPPTVVLP